MQRVEENEETTLRSEGTSLLKKSLTEPALLEMSGNPTNRELTALPERIQTCHFSTVI
jgi:hypothetical protein